MIFQLRDFIQREHSANIQQIARFLRMDEAALQPLLNLLVKKGVIKIREEQNLCKSQCMGCKINTNTYCS